MNVIFVLQMDSINMSFSIRLLSWLYVNTWIPIRLAYLRMKIALRPAVNVTCEILALFNMILSFVPISTLMVSAEIINASAKEWLRLCCLGYEKSIGVEPGSLYEKYLSNNRLMTFCDEYSCDVEDEAVEGNGNEDETVKEQPDSVMEEAEILKEVD